MLDEQWVALGCGLDADELHSRQRAAGEAHQHLLDLGISQPAERDALRPPAAEKSRADTGERPLRVEVGLPVSADEDDLAVAEPLGEVAEQQHRRLVGPLEVVEHDQQRLGALRGDERVEDRFEQRLAPPVERGIRTQRRPPHLGAEAGHELGQHGAAAGGELLKRSLWCHSDRAGQDIAERRVRGFLLLGAAAAEHDPPLARGFSGDFRDQARSADARSPGEEDHAAGAGGGTVQDEANVELLLGATHEAVARGGDDRGDRGRHLAGCRLVQAPPVWESLQLVVAAVREVDLGHWPDQLPHDLGDEYLTALGLARDPRGHVDGCAEDVARLLDDLTGVDADADPKPSVWVRLAVVGDRALDGERALDRMPRRAEAHHHAVAEALDAPSSVLGDHLADDGLVGLHDLVRLGEAARREQVGRAFDVCEHDRDGAFCLTRREAADDRVRGQRR